MSSQAYRYKKKYIVRLPVEQIAVRCTVYLCRYFCVVMMRVSFICETFCINMKYEGCEILTKH